MTGSGETDAGTGGAEPRRRVAASRMGLALLLGALFAGAGTALGQTGGATGQGTSPLPPAPPERIEPAPATPGGVLRPPQGVDPGIRATVPNPQPNTTPVLPPPGTPGGDRTVQPR